MTGHFGASPRASVCVTLNCHFRIQPGAEVYFFRGLERQTVCLSCAKARWGYEPSMEVERVTPAPERQSIGFDSTGAILRKLQQANRNDPRMRAAGGDR